MRIIYDVGSKEYKLSQFDGLLNKQQIIVMGFENNGKLPVFFKDFSANIAIFDEDGSRINYANFPKGNEVYVETDQEILWEFHLFGLIIPEKNYTIVVDVSNDGHEEHLEKVFSVERPESPFPSWSWNPEIGAWEPPIPMPGAEAPYTWNEVSKNWEEITEI